MVSVDEFENEFECYFYDITNKLKLNQIYFKNNYLKMNADKRGWIKEINLCIL